MQCHACTRTDGLRRQKYRDKGTGKKIMVLLCPDHRSLPYFPSGDRLPRKEIPPPPKPAVGVPLKEVGDE